MVFMPSSSRTVSIFSTSSRSAQTWSRTTASAGSGSSNFTAIDGAEGLTSTNENEPTLAAGPCPSTHVARRSISPEAFMTSRDGVEAPTPTVRGLSSESGVVVNGSASRRKASAQRHRRQLTAPFLEPAVTSSFHPPKAAKTSPFSRSGTLK